MDFDVSGMTIVLLAGAVGSATLLPMKFVKRWNWENTWLLYAFNAYLLLPVFVAWATVPDLLRVYQESGLSTVLQVLVFGLGWGLSVVLLGLAVASVGLAVSNGIILGCSIAIGSLVPLLLIDASQLLTLDGWRIILADAVILAGVLLCARAAFLREQSDLDEQKSRSMGYRGVVLCFIAGILTPLINLALSSGNEIVELALQHGAQQEQAANGVWGLTVGAGSLPSLIYCMVLLRRNQTWSKFSAPGWNWNVALCILMAACFFASTVLYGIGALKMGRLGPAFGWPVYISSLILGNSFWGWRTGEWRDAPRVSIRFMLVGLLLQVVGIMILFAGKSISSG